MFIGGEGVFVKSAVKETLPEDNRFIGGVVPRLGIANLSFSKPLVFGLCRWFFLSGIFLIGVVFWLGVEPDSDCQFRLKNVRMHHHIGSLTVFLTDRDYFMC